MPRRALHLIAYDVTDDRARAAILKAVRAFGLDGQKSVHECALSLAERRELEARLAKAIDPKTDRLLVMRLDPRGRIDKAGASEPAKPPAFFYVG